MPTFKSQRRELVFSRQARRATLRHRAAGSPVDQNGAKIVDVGSRRSGHDEIAERREEAITVIVGEPGFRVDARCGGQCQTVWKEKRASIVLRAIYSIGIGGKRGNADVTIERDAQGEQKF